MPRAGVDYPGFYGDFLAWFGDDEDCLDYLDWLRWPDGHFLCPFGQCPKRWKVAGRWRCAGCRRWVSATGGTLFAKTGTPLTIWVEAAWRMSTSKSGVSALELQHTLGIGSYQTVWTMLHSFRLAMGAGAKDRLSGAVEVDEKFFGGPAAARRDVGRWARQWWRLPSSMPGGMRSGVPECRSFPMPPQLHWRGFSQLPSPLDRKSLPMVYWPTRVRLRATYIRPAPCGTPDAKPMSCCRPFTW